jgi:hypothetical protein
MTTYEPTKHTSDLVDPYALDPKDIQDPPTHLAGKLRFLGPGMITSAAVVGSGELREVHLATIGGDA